ncbi:cell division protein FtsA [Anaerosinus massiliensis]|uniref:cell division protein FtsA n=1 Tax=Massilibacillus massiliensis TaxID=1806837 RepID=UPI000B2877AE|nr:cell division FtsA domain-containing protein [Massilibacillus massiliensis]
MQKNLLFSLDIGTRSVIGIVAEQVEHKIKIIATERKEHNTRAMLDGQIHDVPEVAAILEDVKKQLEEKVGPLKSASVAAAGRALYTINASAELEVSEILTIDDEHALDYAAIQSAQHKLATSSTVDDPTMYYCVGYSTVSYKLDGVQLKTLVGQRGKIAKADVIATFLPRQVIDSMKSALHEAKLEMASLTLEPIAGINVLIPPTMRHLNLVLVDIGAGTSDVAITKNGSVIAYGMVPFAGDEITEALSQHYLLDFNVAEQIKRELNNPNRNAEDNQVSFQDILGMTYTLSPKEINDKLSTNVAELAQAIATQILTLNGAAPQAVLLVGGGSLTPMLPEAIAQALDIPTARVAVRTPDTIQNIEDIPEILKRPDAVTPLGILKIASTQTLNFITIYVNKNELHLFNISNLTVSDALLAAGIDMKQLGGKPGLGLTVKINNQTKFFAGTLGKPAKFTLNGEATTLTAPIANGDKICVTNGIDGYVPTVKLNDVVDAPPAFMITVNDEEFTIDSKVLVNHKTVDAAYQLKDRDEITYQQIKKLGDILLRIGYQPADRHFKYKVNGASIQQTVSPTITINEEPASLSSIVNPEDRIICIEPKTPTVEKIIDINTMDTYLTVHFNKNPSRIPTTTYTLTVDGNPASLQTLVRDGSEIQYSVSEKAVTMISDVLLATNFQPPSALSHVKVEILLNQESAEYTSLVKNGDSVDVIITPL